MKSSVSLPLIAPRQAPLKYINYRIQGYKRNRYPVDIIN